MLLKEIGRKIAQAFRLARAADEMIGKALARKEDMAKTVVDDWRAYFE